MAGGTYLFALPGSPGACRDGWDEILVHQLDYRHRPCNFVEIMPRLDELKAAGEELLNLDTGETLDSLGMPPLTANAYLGGRGITAALAAGADVVVTDTWVSMGQEAEKQHRLQQFDDRPGQEQPAVQVQYAAGHVRRLRPEKEPHPGGNFL